MKITDSIYQVDEVFGGTFLLVAADYLSLVDTGVPNNEGKIFALVESLGRKPSDLKHILLTHSDGDHIGSLPALVSASGATGTQVYAQAIEAEVIEGKHKSRGGQMVANPVTVQHVVKEGDTLPLHGGIRVVETFGHTIGHVCYWLASENLLFTGDCLVNTEGLSSSRPQYTYNTEQAIATVKKLAQLAPASLCFGHGNPIIGNAATQLQQLAASL
jgi:glyoxylase-like metal-dependent hydrolase (beta-lactamase superfamily II)